MVDDLAYRGYARKMLASTPAADAAVVAALTLMAEGGQLHCPFCTKRWKANGYHFHRLFAPVRDHATSVHPEQGKKFEATIKWVCSEVEASGQRKARAAEHETKARVTRKVVVTGGLLDEVVGELRSLIDMMQSYYNGCEQDAEALIERLEALAAGKATADGGPHLVPLDHLAEI